jgi:alpha-galactosidase/6-phospho-beta-glucosidase family protein
MNEYGDVLEAPYQVINGILKPKPNNSPAPEAIKQTLDLFLRYERLAARAVYSRDESMLATALAIHPWVNNQEVIPDLVRHVIQQDFQPDH